MTVKQILLDKNKCILYFIICFICIYFLLINILAWFLAQCLVLH